MNWKRTLLRQSSLRGEGEPTLKRNALHYTRGAPGNLRADDLESR